jgi:hypothetical protein
VKEPLWVRILAVLTYVGFGVACIGLVLLVLGLCGVI